MRLEPILPFVYHLFNKEDNSMQYNQYSVYNTQTQMNRLHSIVHGFVEQFHYLKIKIHKMKQR